LTALKASTTLVSTRHEVDGSFATIAQEHADEGAPLFVLSTAVQGRDGLPGFIARPLPARTPNANSPIPPADGGMRMSTWQAALDMAERADVS
jgi:hypothetical protein